MAKTKKKRKKKVDTVRPYKLGEFQTFIRWTCIPPSFRNADKATLEELGFGEEFLLLAGIKTKEKLAEFLGIERHALTAWAKLPDFQNRVEEFHNKFIRSHYKGEVDHSFTMKVIKEGDAGRVRLWKELFEGHVPTIKTEMDGDPFANMLDKLTIDELKKIREVRKSIADRVKAA